MEASKDPAKNSSKYPKKDLPQLALELDVPVSQRGRPDLAVKVPNRFVTLEEAKFYGMSWYFTGSDVCRYGHNSARRVANPAICACCARVAAGEEPIYGKSRTQKYYDKPRRPSKDASARVVIAAPATAPAQLEPTKKEQEFLAAHAEHGDIDKACAAVGWTLGQFNARLAVNEVFKTAFNALTDRLGIATRAPDAETFKWTREIERQYVRLYVDCGMAQQARNDLGISASDFHARIAASPTFASLVEDAHPLAALTLRDRATQAAAVGKIDLLKYLEAGAPKDDLSGMSVEQMNREIEKLLRGFRAQGLLPNHMRHKLTGQIFECDDLECVTDDGLPWGDHVAACNGRQAPDSSNENLDLVGATE